MNQSKMKYLRERIDSIGLAKHNAIRAKYRGVTLSPKEKIAALEAGEFTIDPSRMKNGYSWSDAIKFDDQPDPMANLEKEERELEELKAKVVRLKDELILGEEDEALALLREFEAS